MAASRGEENTGERDQHDIGGVSGVVPNHGDKRNNRRQERLGGAANSRPHAGCKQARPFRDTRAEHDDQHIAQRVEVRECLWHVDPEALASLAGGITIEGLTDWKESGMDVVSTSAVNRGVAPLDLTMLMDGV